MLWFYNGAFDYAQMNSKNCDGPYRGFSCSTPVSENSPLRISLTAWARGGSAGCDGGSAPMAVGNGVADGAATPVYVVSLVVVCTRELISLRTGVRATKGLESYMNKITVDRNRTSQMNR